MQVHIYVCCVQYTATKCNGINFLLANGEWFVQCESESEKMQQIMQLNLIVQLTARFRPYIDITGVSRFQANAWIK